MTDLDLALRTPGTVVLLEPARAAAMAERSLLGQRPQSGLFANALGLVGLAPRGDRRPARPDTLALPALPWAGSVEPGEGYCIVDGVAVLEIEGVLTPEGYYDWWQEQWVGGYAQIDAAVSAARADDRVHALFARVNSPGGLTSGCFELAHALREGNAAHGGKPFWVHAPLACSAAYALAAGADRILAPVDGDVGSIGVYIMHVDTSEWLAEVGIKVEAIQSHPNKTDGAGWKPLSDEARTHLQAVVAQTARRFSGVVEAGRPLSADAIAALSGRWFLAEHDDPALSGLALGLVDEIATERAAFAALVQSLSDQSGSGAPAGTGTDAAKPAARTTQVKETEMSLADEITALRAKASRGDKAALRQLKALGVNLKAKAETEDTEEEAEADEEEAETEETDEEAETDEDEAESEDTEEEAEDDEREPSAKARGTKAGFALVGSKHAKGREALASKLGAKVAAGKLSYGEAVGMLAVAPRKGRLGDAMAGRDHNPGQDRVGGGKAGAGLAAAVDRFNAKRARK